LVPSSTLFSTLSLHDALPISLSGTAFGTVYGALSRIFEPQRRSWALAVAGAIGGLGQFCLVPFVQHLLVRAGWQDAAMVLGLMRSEEHTSELQSRENLVCRLL